MLELVLPLMRGKKRRQDVAARTGKGNTHEEKEQFISDYLAERPQYSSRAKTIQSLEEDYPDRPYETLNTWAKLADKQSAKTGG